MWVYFCYSIVFAFVISTNLAQYGPKNAYDPNKETEAIFASVIKNISRVNNVLQELINNYEHLQQIYKSQENLESASSDAEIDEIFKSKKKKKKAKFKGTSNTPDDIFLATQVIWSNSETNHDDNNSNNSESSEPDKSENNDLKPSGVLSTKDSVLKLPINNTSDDTTTAENQENYDIDDQENQKQTDQSESEEEVIDSITTESKVLKQQPIIPKQAEILFVDTHKTIYPSKEQNIGNSVDNKKQILTSPQTRYNKVSLRHETKNKHRSKNKASDLRTNFLKKNDVTQNTTQIKELKTKSKDETENNVIKSNIERNKKVEKKLHFELFSPKNIWNEIISNKPIQLEAHNEMVFEKVYKNNIDAKSKTPIKMRSENSKTASIIVSNKNKTGDLTKNFFNNDTGERSEINVDSIDKDEFEAGVLREAYGGACLKLVVRKCYLATKQAGNNVCRRFKCRGIYKEKFDSLARTACIEEFNGNNSLTVFHRVRESAEFPDEKEGYMDVCLPHIQTILRDSNMQSETSSRTIQGTSNTRKRNNFNIIRSKYERACKKRSCGKCQVACRRAFQNICQTYPCSSAKKKIYQRSCKVECKRVYRLDNDSSDSSDSDTGSSDEDNTGSSE